MTAEVNLKQRTSEIIVDRQADPQSDRILNAVISVLDAR